MAIQFNKLSQHIKYDGPQHLCAFVQYYIIAYCVQVLLKLDKSTVIHRLPGSMMPGIGESYARSQNI